MNIALAEAQTSAFDIIRQDLSNSVGERALKGFFDVNDEPRDLIVLSSALFDESIVLEPLPLEERLDVDAWEIPDYVTYGKVLVRLVRAYNVENDETALLRARTLNRAYYLGLGPHLKRFTAPDRFGSLWNFHQEIDYHPKYKRGQFDSWSHNQLLKHVDSVFKATRFGKDQPIAAALDEKARSETVPSSKIIRRRIGTVQEVLDLLGYPDISKWERDDYIDFGVKVMRANAGQIPKRHHFDYLSSQRRGPSTRTIFNHFGKLSYYQKLIKDAYDIDQMQRARERAATLTAIHAETEAGTLPKYVLMKVTNEKTQIARYSRHKVIEKVAPELPIEDKIVLIATHDGDTFSSQLHIAEPSVSLAEIEVTASILGVFDVIWQLEANLRHLRVPRSVTWKNAWKK
jgi:hypothetical protein